MSECTLWTGRLDRKGYGRVGRGSLAYRVLWEQTNGPIPAGMVLDHICRTPACVNLNHLRVVTVAENTAAGLMGFALTGRCRNGLHDVTDPANVYVPPNGRRQCRLCKEHAEAQPRPHTTCPSCGIDITIKNLARHARAKHGSAA